MAESILDRWDFSLDELTCLVDSNPSLRGMFFGYVAEAVLRKMYFSDKKLCAIKRDDHNRKEKGDLIVTYKHRKFRIECKTIQTNSIKQSGDEWAGKVQCDGSDKRLITFPDASQLRTTLLLTGEFDILAVNCFSFGDEWRFAFAKNEDLPRTTFKKYSKKHRAHLLASTIPISWPPQPPFYTNPFDLMDSLLEERKAQEQVYTVEQPYLAGLL